MRILIILIALVLTSVFCFSQRQALLVDYDLATESAATKVVVIPFSTNISQVWSVQVVWEFNNTGEALDATAEIQSSDDGVNWNRYASNYVRTLDKTGEYVVLGNDTIANQIFEDDYIGCNFLRVLITKNNDAGSVLTVYRTLKETR